MSSRVSPFLARIHVELSELIHDVNHRIPFSTSEELPFLKTVIGRINVIGTLLEKAQLEASRPGPRPNAGTSAAELERDYREMLATNAELARNASLEERPAELHDRDRDGGEL